LFHFFLDRRTIRSSFVSFFMNETFFLKVK